MDTEWESWIGVCTCAWKEDGKRLVLFLLECMFDELMMIMLFD